MLQATNQLRIPEVSVRVLKKRQISVYHQTIKMCSSFIVHFSKNERLFYIQNHQATKQKTEANAPQLEAE
jgi:hypothetical protein